MFAQDGALGFTFKIVRALQAASMIAIIGMTSNFIAQMVSANLTPPSAIVGTLSVICIAVLYCVITFILYLDNLLPFLIGAGIDGLFLIALIVVSVVVGKPLSYLDCNVIGGMSGKVPSSASGFANALADSVLSGTAKIIYDDWIGTSKATCLEMKSIWGLCIALCILFFLSSVVSICLWKRNRMGGMVYKGEA